METMWIFSSLVVFATQYLSECQPVTQGPADFCFLEKFEPQCSNNEVLLIQTALYGRMKIGKCIKPNSERLGCYADVLRIMDNLCSGKRTCSVQAIHPDLTATNPCGSENLLQYLSVSYKCVIAGNLKKGCNTNSPIVLTSSKGFIASEINHRGCPIIIEPNRESRLNITIFNFMKPKERSACYEVAKIKEENTEKILHICENKERTTVAHLSSSSRLKITFSHSEELDKLGSFMIYYEVIGCPSPPVPENAHAIREGDTATIVCNNSDTTWTTTCKDNKWTQQDRECPTSWSFTGIVKSSKDFPYGIFLTSIIGVALGILIGGFLLFLAVNAFQRYQRGKLYDPPPVIPDPDYKIYDTAKMDLPFIPGFGHSTMPRHQMAAADAPQAPPPLSEETMKRLSRHTYERPNFPPP